MDHIEPMFNRPQNHCKKQQGIALITAMVTVSIIVSLAAMVMYRQQIQIRLSSNIRHLEQAYQYAYGMEDWAGTILLRSFDDHPEYDSLLDDWYNNGDSLILPIDGGVMQGRLIDLQSRINVNSVNRPFVETTLKKEPQENGQTFNARLAEQKKIDEFQDVATITRRRLTRLMQIVDPDQEMGPPENFVDILKDWIDADEFNGNPAASDEGTGNGAESPYYQSQEPAYFSANTEMVSTTEIRLLKDMQEKVYEKIKDHVNTLPIKKNNQPIDTKININTASTEVLQAIGFTPEEIENIENYRKNDAFTSFENFKTELPIEFSSADDPNNGVNPNDIDVKSNYFLLEGSVEINNARLFINSVLERKDKKVSVIMRDFSNPETIKTVEN